MRVLLVVILLLVAGVASAAKSNPPSDGTDDRDQGLGNDGGAKGSQDDLGDGGDASDRCEAPSPDVGDGGAGTLRPPADKSDNYALAAAAGEAHHVTVTPTGGDIGLNLTIWSPGCAELVAWGSPARDGSLVAFFVADETGTYTVRVASVGGDSPTKGPGGKDPCRTDDCFVIASGHCYPTCRAGYLLESSAAVE